MKDRTVFVDLGWDKKKKKKTTAWGETWGDLKKTSANASAIKTGKGLVVVDIDTKDLRKVDKGLMSLLTYPTVETKRGYHYYFKTDDKFTTMTGLFEHVDIRGEGGLVFNDYWGDNENISYDTVGEIQEMPKKLGKYIHKTYGGNKDKKSNKAIYNNTDKSKMLDILSHIGCYDDYTEWCNVGMSLKAWDKDAGLKLWDKWSKQSDAYEAGACADKWKTFDADGDMGVGTLYHLAEQNGYVIEKKPMFKKVEGRVSVADPSYVAPVVEEEDEEEGEREVIDWEVLEKIQDEVMRVKGGFEMLNDEGKWIFVLQTELWMAIYKIFGNPFNRGVLDNIDAEIVELGSVIEEKDGSITKKHTGKDVPVKIEALKNQKKSLEDEFNNARRNVTSHITTYNQYEEKYIEIDPFKSEDKVWLFGDTVHISLHDMFPNVDIKKPKFDTSVFMDDYREHFAHFDEFLDFITASRFAPDRKKAYLYTKMVSDFGKSFIGDVFSQLGLVAEINEKELKKAGTGDPVGLSASMFKTAWILFFDEVKYINADFKVITSKMMLSPKGQKRVTVPIYSKWLANAEGLDSLVNNTERQFANRFSFWDMGNKSLDERDLFRKSKADYFIAIKWEVYKILQKNIKEYVGLGKREAYNVAQKRLEKFHKTYGLEESMEDNVEEFIKLIMERIENVVNSGKFKHDGIDKVIHHDFGFDSEGKLYAVRLGSLNHIFTTIAKEVYGDDYKSIIYKAHYLRECFSPRSSVKIKGSKINAYRIKSKK